MEAFIVESLALVLFVYWVAVVILLIYDDREPAVGLAWLLILFFAPLLGLFLYLVGGRDWKEIARRKKWVTHLHEAVAAAMQPIYARNSGAQERFDRRYDGTFVERIGDAITAANGTHPLPADSLDLFVAGVDKFAHLRRDLAEARTFIHMQYFIWECDELTAKITAILLDRLAAGVEVRVMYDFIGSLWYKKHEIKRLRRAGARVKADITDIARINYRNHRKIVVIDGEIGYTGGLNLGQEYIDGGKRFACWRDTHLRFTGQAVAELEKLFAVRWYERSHEILLDERYLPAPAQNGDGSGTLLQIVAHGVEDPWESARRAHMVAMAQAERSIHIQSPYFVPDYSIYDILMNAALSGVDVRLMMTGVLDKKLPFWAAQSYFKNLLTAGAHIYLYEAGFFHAKTISVDGEIAAVGTMNMDVRSLRLHKEVMVWVYDREFAAQVERSFQADLEHCHEVTPEDVASVNRVVNFRNSTVRLFSNVL